jgi:hypothetical protein
MGRGSSTREATLKYLFGEISSRRSALNIWQREGAYEKGIYALSADEVKRKAADYRAEIAALQKQITRIEAGEDSNKFYVARVRLDSGGYDSGGAYWGTPNDVFRYESEDGATYGTMRANSLHAARAQVSELFPGAEFLK